MRILQVTPYFEDAWAYGGIPRAAAATARGLAARGHAVTVCTSDAGRVEARMSATQLARAKADRQLDVRVFPNLSNNAAYRLQFFLPAGMRRYLRTHAGDFDVAHLHGCHHLPGAWASKALKRAGVPYAITPHGTAPYLERRQLAKRLFDATLGRGVIEGAACVIAVSEAESRQLIALGVAPDKIRVVGNPVEIAEVPDAAGRFRQRLGLSGDVPLVLFLGKFTAQKRLDVLVSAMAALDRAGAHLVIAGNDMGYGGELRRLIDACGIAPRVHLPGLLTGGERFLALSDADVVVYPSQGEVFGLVPVEALLAGTPVIVSNDSGCGEVISETGGGLLVSPGDVLGLRDAIATVIDHRPAWRAVAAQARVRAQRFRPDSICTELESLYAAIARTTSSSAVDDEQRVCDHSPAR